MCKRKFHEEIGNESKPWVMHVHGWRRPSWCPLTSMKRHISRYTTTAQPNTCLNPYQMGQVEHYEEVQLYKIGNNSTFFACPPIQKST